MGTQSLYQKGVHDQLKSNRIGGFPRRGTLEQDSEPRPLESFAFHMGAPFLPEKSVTLANKPFLGAELSSCL